MTPDEIRENAQELADNGFVDTNTKLLLVAITMAAAEICERLDAIHATLKRTPRGGLTAEDRYNLEQAGRR